jgi:RNA polymerase sigma-70 factor (ECF subfamily)
MTSSVSGERPGVTKDGRFTTTQWSLVISAGQGGTPESRQALAALCEKYWYPLYVFIRRRGYEIEDAQDLTQGYFAQLLDKGYLKEVRRERGKFRSFLLASLKHYMANERDRAQAQKRGGGQVTLSLDFETAEGRYGLEAVDDQTPEKTYERRWVLALLDQALERLRTELAEQGKADLFERLKPYLTSAEPRTPYRQLADETGTTEGALKVAVHRLRRRYGDLLREEIAETVANRDEVEDEIQYLFAVFG